MKRSPLRRKTRLRNRKPINPISAKKRAADRVYATNRAAVHREAGGLCTRRHPGCKVYATQTHHEKHRGQGGGHEKENLGPACWWCHMIDHDERPVDSHPQWSRKGAA